MSSQIYSDIKFPPIKRVVDHDYKCSKKSTIWWKCYRSSTQELMSHTPKIFQAIHIYFTKSDKSSIWILCSSLLFLINNTNLGSYIFTQDLQATQSKYQIAKRDNNWILEEQNSYAGGIIQIQVKPVGRQ